MVIVISGRILAAHTYGTTGPVVCFSELSDNALHAQLSRGFTSRGPYQPWAVVLRKDHLLAWGARPVLYLNSEEMHQTEGLPSRLRDPRVRAVPGGSPDWLHEREWRLCLDGWPDCPPTQWPGYYLGEGGVEAVIVGKSNWLAGARVGASFRGAARWLWTGSGLINDGVLG